MNNFCCEILLVRHGQSIGNEKRLFLGHTDLDLSALGYRQAQLCAEALKAEKIDAVYSSDLSRAYNTALPHARLRGLEITKMKELRELYAGEWEGMHVDEIKEKYPHEYLVLWREHFASFDALRSAESVPQLADRIYSALLDVAMANRGKKILVASHGAAIRALWGRICGHTPDEASSLYDFPTNASVTRVGFDGKALVPIIYSDDSALGDMSTRWIG